ncbi:hypothetical protein [Rhizobium wenxiniae]|uniref:hypothetical protein n=1 Tax=Rhizobium wenxiniae TaxID=1737357 RepID=UPI001C6F2E91|nr:hypothetical protein [Rhizobium wenxiniae]
MREPIAIADENADIRTSIGGIWTDAKRDVSELLKEADLYEAKAVGKDAVRFQSASRTEFQRGSASASSH